MEEWILDTNIFINAAHKYYSMDFCPAFWQWLLQNTNHVFSIDMVKDELDEKKDDVSAWCRDNLPKGFFRKSDEGVQDCYGKVVEYINSLPESPYSLNKKNDFLSGADPMLIAYAMEHGGILVTDEKLNPAAHKKIYLPSVAEHFKIKCTDIFDVLRQLKAKFVLE